MAARSDTAAGIKRDWLIRSYREGDEDQLYELRRALDPERYSSKEAWLKWFHWQYKEYPGEISPHVVEASGKIIGHSCQQVVRMKVAGEKVKGRFPLDLAVHPDYRKLGVGAAIFKFGKALLEEKENFISYGVPNRLGYQHALKQGFVDIGYWRRMIRVLDWEHFLSDYVSNRLVLKLGTFFISTFAGPFLGDRRAPKVSGLEIKKVTSFDARVDEFLAAASEKFKITIIKSMDYLNWKYATFTKSRYNIFIAEKSGAICGYLVMSQRKKEHIAEALLYEFLAESEHVARYMISAITEYCRRENMDLITWVGLADRSYLRAFRKQGFLSRSRRDQWRFVVYSNHPNIPIKYLMDPRNWLMQRGDVED